jgi:hypothetical protein
MVASMLNPTYATPLIAHGIATGQYPARLYKYRGFDAYTDSIFANNRLWFSDSAAFNDPFDCQIVDSGNYTRSDIFDYLVSRGVPTVQATQLADDHAANPALFPALLAQVKQAVLGSKGILSMSRINNNILMWSHYAASHSGFVLGFDVATDIPFFTTPLHVRYVNDYPAFQYLRESDKIVSHGLLSKSTLWNYEQEVRIIKNAQGLHPFNKQSLTQVILGSRTDAANKTRILQLLRTHGYNHVTVSETVPSSARYELELRPVIFP